MLHTIQETNYNFSPKFRAIELKPKNLIKTPGKDFQNKYQNTLINYKTPVENNTIKGIYEREIERSKKSIKELRFKNVISNINNFYTKSNSEYLDNLFENDDAKNSIQYFYK